MKTSLPIVPIAGMMMTSCTQQNTSDQPRPNVIIIMTDDVGYGDIGCYGSGIVPTPHMDSLAAGGIRFGHAYAAAATSTPSRYSMLTGAYAWRRADTGVADGDDAMVISPEQYTVADLFAESGYRTAVIGKWHLGLGNTKGGQAWNDKISPNPSDLGFDYSYIMAATGDRVPCVWIEDGRVVNHDEASPIAVSYQRPYDGEPLGHDHPEALRYPPSHGHDMAIVDSISRIGYMTGGGQALWRDEEIGQRITDRALHYIEQSVHAEETFFLYLCTNDIHVPRYPAAQFRGQSPTGLRGDALLQLDYTVGQVVQRLTDLGIADETLIILTSDNGPVLDDGYADEAVERNGTHRATGSLRGGKYSLYEGGTRVPMIVRWPGQIPEGMLSDALVSQVDLMATMAELLGHTTNSSSQVPADSHPQWSAWSGQSSSGRRWVIEQGLRQLTAIRIGDLKYIPPTPSPNPVAWQTGIETGQSSEPALYDLSRDLNEQVNIATEQPRMIRDMQAMMDSVRMYSPYQR